MKKRKTLAIGIIILMILIGAKVSAQEKDAEKPVFITVTTLHRNLDSKLKAKDWKAAEQEYFDKVTSKNDLIIGSEIITHYYTEDNTEIALVNVYRTWEDIEKANAVSDDLIKKGWPDEKSRKAFFEKYDSFYTPVHSDEIYQSVTSIGRKDYKDETKKPMIVYLRKSQLSMKGDSKKAKEFNDKITFKDPYIKAYYPLRHSWGSNSTDFLEVFYYDSLADMEKSSDKIDELIKSTWPNEKDADAFFDELEKSFTGKHSDYIYRNVPSVSK
ncbi:hypothetical protein SAMN06265349_105430 [Flavobacterium resistens]|uniref:NIPSNAP protein n=1 Tax=Flavobacterium resistens TaxID=443612 RepID=A0A521EV64_9FLAO|nr:hypothetical protein [Flavobacterium resistens]MRX68054.1 hypothetical protein [Flavobacterium resistens]SMO87817.1 hypothetical protein SAMN06265349_105430 [Flavobacterium resistens]